MALLIAHRVLERPPARGAVRRLRALLVRHVDEERARGKRAADDCCDDKSRPPLARTHLPPMQSEAISKVYMNPRSVEAELQPNEPSVSSARRARGRAHAHSHLLRMRGTHAYV